MSELTTSSGLGSAAPFWVGIRGFGALPCNFLTILRRASTCEQGSGSWSQPAGVGGGARCPPSRAPTSCNAGMRRGEILAPCSPHACSCSLWGASTGLPVLRCPRRQPAWFCWGPCVSAPVSAALPVVLVEDCSELPWFVCAVRRLLPPVPDASSHRL